MKRAHVFFSGRVQGVNFRAFVAANARRLSLAGWVCNRLDGRVEAVFEGEPEVIEQMLARCRNAPPPARVDAVENDDSEAAAGLTDFEVKATK